MTFKDVFYNYFLPDDLSSLANTSDKERQKCSIKRGDVFLTRTSETLDELGMSCVALKDYPEATFNGFTKRLRLKPNADVQVDPVFLGYYLRSDEFRQQVTAVSSITTRASLNTTHINALEVKLPEYNAQVSIGEMLKPLDDKIELNRRMNATLEAMAQAVFKDWFVAKEEVPAGWKPMKLGAMLALEKGLSYKGQFLSDDQGLSMVNLGSFGPGGRFQGEKLKHYTGEYKAKHIVRAKDIVMANTDITQNREVIGSPALLPPNIEGDVLFTHHVFALRIHPAFEKYRLFIYYSLLQDAFRERAVGYSTGTTVLSLPRDTVEEHEILLPDSKTIERFNAIVEPLIERGWQNNSESLTLAALRDTLLPKLMRGEVRVKTTREHAVD